MADVFMSYSESESDIAEYVASLLDTTGISAWHWKRDIHYSEPHPQQTFREIDRAKCVLCLISSSTFTSDFVFPEILRGYAQRKPFFVVLRGIHYGQLEETKPRWCQAFGFTPALAWDDQVPKEAVLKVVRELELLCGSVSSCDKSKTEREPNLKGTKEANLAASAQEAMGRLLTGQQSGSTLAKWCKDTYDQLTKDTEHLPDELKIPRILDRLTDMVSRDDQWERSNSDERQFASERALAERDDKGSGHAQGAAALASVMFHGVTEDNRTLHKTRREILSDLAYMKATRKAAAEIVEHLRARLCR